MSQNRCCFEAAAAVVAGVCETAPQAVLPLRIVEGSAQPTKRCNAILSFSNKFLSNYGRTVLRIKGMVSKQAGSLSGIAADLAAVARCREMQAVQKGFHVSIHNL